MLVLSRKVGESIVIGDDVVVTILEIRGDLIRVGIDAPKSVKVHRSEVFEAIEAANKEAVAPTLEAMSEFASAIKDLPLLPKIEDPE
ncbi:MAG: carbon storage regulator CsrA [Candidatus Nanopelagicales bacterium]|jgi:carbon storage regulator|nr:carbon storage regulator CsrA [Actinomycetota bacterium]NCG03144.1 carbon storage regulator CsrA [Actinomycetales bacterium]MBT5183489.1 carbon storage regulator CsrA [Actinomycetota bacterium]MBT5502234.1 carbon storage regulator CsrA [Actinomycetota bacterium]MBT5806641.1 carbon storage regulator CsrA [Actinomycetota bacterium]